MLSIVVLNYNRINIKIYMFFTKSLIFDSSKFDEALKGKNK